MSPPHNTASSKNRQFGTVGCLPLRRRRIPKVYPVDGREVIPFWSSRRRIEAIQKSFPKYQGYEITEMSLADFLQWLPRLTEEGIHIGTNWSGKRLVGYDVSVQDLLAGLEFWINRSKEE